MFKKLRAHHSSGRSYYVLQEGKLFFKDLSEDIIQDDVILRLMSFPNVLITAHQGFLTDEALTQIALVTIQNVEDFADGKELVNKVE